MRVDLGNEAVGTIVEDPEGVAPAFEPHPGGMAMTTGAGDSVASGYCLWEFDGAAWILKKDRCNVGYVPSAPPSAPGRFRGQIRAVMAVPESAMISEPVMIVSALER
jgi:hypothetical protein